MAEPKTASFDILVIGAGISGINAGFRLQQMLPSASYAILEARDAIGGTWDFFKYPGFRSDSDLYTFGFPWRPWEARKSIAEGDLILEYMKESAAEYGIDKKVKLRHRVEQADWRSAEKRWKLNVTITEGDTERSEVFDSKWIVFCTGYYVKLSLSSHQPMLTDAGLQDPPSCRNPRHLQLCRPSHPSPVLAQISRLLFQIRMHHR
jgi:cation diffusion facilitator CzcD-associated flavoprotein CzcO